MNLIGASYEEGKPLTELILGEDYYMEDGLLVMTALYHAKRARCCGNGCRWCPYEPRHQAGAAHLTTDGEFWAEAASCGEGQAQA